MWRAKGLFYSEFGYLSLGDEVGSLLGNLPRRGKVHARNRELSFLKVSTSFQESSKVESEPFPNLFRSSLAAAPLSPHSESILRGLEVGVGLQEGYKTTRLLLMASAPVSEKDKPLQLEMDLVHVYCIFSSEMHHPPCNVF